MIGSRGEELEGTRGHMDPYPRARNTCVRADPRAGKRRLESCSLRLQWAQQRPAVGEVEKGDSDRCDT